MEILEIHLNQPVVKQIVTEILNQNDLGHNHGKIIHASYTHFPNNLINGPHQSHRGDNGKANVDTALLNEQSSEFKDKVKKFIEPGSTKDKLVAFTALPDTKSVKFKKYENGKFYVKPNSNND